MATPKPGVPDPFEPEKELTKKTFELEQIPENWEEQAVNNINKLLEDNGSDSVKPTE